MTMAEQLVFDLPVQTAFGRDDFFVTVANAQAVGAIEAPEVWPLGKLVLVGPDGAGKSHLARIWAAQVGARLIAAHDLAAQDLQALAAGAVCVEDVPALAGQQDGEQALFHLHNLLQQNGQLLLMTGRGVPSAWGMVLPDLASRVQGSLLVQLASPDDGLLGAVLLKLCADRQLQVEPGVIEYILQRIERSFGAVQRLVAALDKESLQRKRPIGQRMAARSLKYLEDEY